MAGHAPRTGSVRTELLCWAGHHHHQIHENIYIVQVREPNPTCRVARHSPLATYHTRTDASRLELAIRAPSGLNATPVTSSEWPCKHSIITGCKRTSASGCVSRPLPAGQMGWCACMCGAPLGAACSLQHPSPLHKYAQPPLLAASDASVTKGWPSALMLAGGTPTHHIPCAPPAQMHQPT